MLAPPPEGTFDVEDRNLPIKNISKDGNPEQVHLLQQESVPVSSDVHRKEKVRPN